MQGFEFSLLGFDIRIAPTAALLAGVVVIFGLQHSLTLTVVWLSVGFVSILVHELGHALAARGFGLDVLDITFHGVGGQTRHGVPDRPWKSLVIALAGPFAGFVLMALALLAWQLPVPSRLQPFVDWAVWINLIWGIFNLLPVYPLDGGRALASFLAMFMGQLKAYTIAGWIGLVGSVLLGLLALSQGEIFILAIAGMMAANNWQLIQRLKGGGRRW